MSSAGELGTRRSRIWSAAASNDSGTRASSVAECLKARVDVPAACLDEAVGVQHEGGAVGQSGLGGPERRAADAERDAQDLVDDIGPAVRLEDQRRRVALLRRSWRVRSARVVAM